MEVIVKGQPSIEIGFETKVIQVGGLGDIDSSLSTESENPVMNKVITAELSSLGDSVVGNTEAISSLAESKADKDGVYSGMTVGRSIDLLGVDDVEEGSFLFRPTDGDGSIKDGVAVVKSVKGDSVVWNQCFGNVATNKDYLKWEGNKATINGEFDADNVSYDIVASGAKLVAPITNHKYLVEIDVISGTISGGIITHYLPFANKNVDISENQLSVKTFVSSTITSTYYFARTIKAGVIATNLEVMYRVTDLTKMFRAGNEPSTIEEFNARMATLCIEDMNAYNEGEVVNMKASAIKSVGFNAWDEEWELGTYNLNTGEKLSSNRYICSSNLSMCLPNEKYYIKTPKALFVLWYDNSKNYISNIWASNSIIQAPSNATYFAFRTVNDGDLTTYNHDICINLVHSGYRNGEYEPYVEDVLDLPTLDLFPNGMNRIGDVYDEYDSEKSVQRIGIRPYQSGDESIENVLTDGTKTLYVLEEPIVTPHDYRLAYKAWDFGTEQVIADGNTTAITAGITYEFNARDTIRGNKTRLDALEPIVAGKIDKEADDYYPQLAVGLADNLSGVDVVDSEVNFRRSGGGAISDGVARIEAIKGNSEVWNQHGPTERYAGTADNTSGSSNLYVATKAIIAQYTKNINGHIIYAKVEDAYEDVPKYYFEDAVQKNLLGGVIFTANTPGMRSVIDAQIPPGINASWDIKVTFVDLTQMFEAGNEPTTIEEFYQRIPLGVDINAYNGGEIIDMNVQSIESVGVNQWDEEWELGKYNINTGEPETFASYIRSKSDKPIKVLPNTKYYIHNGSAIGQTSIDYSSVIFFYDIDDNFIKRIASTANKTFTTPQNCDHIRFYNNREYGTTYNNDICINISDTSINGKYFPYIKRVEDLSIIRKYFPQGMKSAGTAHDEIRYNKGTQKWEMVQRIGSVDMGTFAWGYNNSVGNERLFTLSLTDVMQVPNTETKGGLLTTLYSAASFNNIYSHSSDKLIGLHTNGQLVVYDSAYTDAATFKNAMQGVILYYELAEPIVTELDAEDQFRNLDYQVWNCGTEKAIAEGISAPLAADITYGFNAIGKIKELESLVAQLRAKVGI